MKAPPTSARGKATKIPNTTPRSVPNGAPSAPQVSAYGIMASRLANRVAEIAENMTFVEKPRHLYSAPPQSLPAPEKKRPRKLEIRLQNTGPDGVSFSAPFLDNTLKKMLSLQENMLKLGAELASEDVPESIRKDQFQQASEMSRIIALICAEKARQGA
ncbi:hypothetical protein P152DRAFT_393226 [Eremomyces bilateralis CBS 781.70]|uniref:Uncharacterized protein n=1 Tax=Eremomyces bilateralis CBS 781.70 TaxID=1392243 RepID=A0A6G1G8Z2_9PEZI|nr:uncharacterized protein P152DRAFT_393226 [Eremomyces bilateralis CBS 781.70]KAF1814548.1 hypothetical protein P152DRAFT_393226 [Eremomyces bilateralis CBS 781.70]